MKLDRRAQWITPKPLRFNEAGPPPDNAFYLEDHRTDFDIFDWEHDTILLKMPDGHPPVPLVASAWLVHCDFVHWLIVNLRPTIVVEVGVFAGSSLLTMRAYTHFYHLQCHLFGVDPWKGENSGTEWWHWPGDKVYEKLAFRTKLYQDVTLLRMYSAEAVSAFPDQSIDLLHIDGDHREEAVRQDIALWLPKIAPRGVVLMHDIGPTSQDCQVYKVWRELRNQYPSFSDTRGLGLGGFCPKGVHYALRDIFKQAIILD